MQIYHWQQHYQVAQESFELFRSLTQQSIILSKTVNKIHERLRLHITVLSCDVKSLEIVPQTAGQAFIILGAKFLAKKNIEEFVENYFTVECLREGIIHAIKFFSIKSLENFLSNMLLTESYPELYQKLWGNEEISKQDRDIIFNGLRAQILRHEMNSKQYLAAALQKFPEQEILYYLVALSASIELLPQLEVFAEQHPEPGYYFLALFGFRAVLPQLLKGLKNSRHAKIASDGWLILTGEQLPLRSALYDAKKTINNVVKIVPDIFVAEQRIEQCAWNDNQRYLFGKEISEENLQNHLKKYQGKINEYMQDLLKLQQVKAGRLNNVSVD